MSCLPGCPMLKASFTVEGPVGSSIGDGCWPCGMQSTFPKFGRKNRENGISFSERTERNEELKVWNFESSLDLGPIRPVKKKEQYTEGRCFTNHSTSHLQRGTSYSGPIKITISSLQLSLTEYREIASCGSCRASILEELQPPNTAIISVTRS